MLSSRANARVFMKSGDVNRGVVLIVEDDENDVFLLRRALAEMSDLSVRAVHDGLEAQRYLRGLDQFSDREKYPLPDVIVCDHNMPECNGVEFTRWFRGEPAWKDIPLIFFSRAWAQHLVNLLVELGVDLCLRKSSAWPDLLETAHIIHQYMRRGRVAG
jgi:CheY-like chemotaxis protein